MNTHSRHLRLLAVLDAVLQERHVSRAAARLHLSQPAASSALAQLRAIYKDPLLVRQGREMVLTPRAEQLLPDVQAAMAASRRVFEPPERFRPAELRRQFHVAATDAVGQTLMPAVMRRLASEAPGVTLRLSAAPADPSEALRADRGIDLVVAHGGPLAAHLRSITLARHALVVVAREGHPVVRGRLTLRQFAAQPQVVVFPHEPALEQALRVAYERVSSEFKLQAAVQHLSVAAAIVAQTDALALLSEPVARLYHNGFGLQSVAPPPELALPRVHVRAIWHERSHADPAAAWLRQPIKDCAPGSKPAADQAATGVSTSSSSTGRAAAG